MASSVPRAEVVRVIEMIRHHLGQLHRRMIPAPVAMMEMTTNAWAAQAITAAADLGIADTLANGPLSADELAVALDAPADAPAGGHTVQRRRGVVVRVGPVPGFGPAPRALEPPHRGRSNRSGRHS
jgi:hypothetical protein